MKYTPSPAPHPPSFLFAAAPCSNPVSFTVKQIRETLDSIKVQDVRPLVSKIFEEAEGISLMQGNLREADVPRCEVGGAGSVRFAKRRPEKHASNYNEQKAKIERWIGDRSIVRSISK